jgi:uncharacterized protein
VTQTELIEKTKNYVRDALLSENNAHDWWHVYRVWNLAKRIGIEEHANMPVVELAALLHDIADWKLHNGDIEIGPKTAQKWLNSQGADKAMTDHVCRIIRDIPFKGGNVPEEKLSLEGYIVRDADRLDALGAIGIARVFTYGGKKGRGIYDPERTPIQHDTQESYINTESPSMNHFYEKLFLLKDRMYTRMGKAIAEKRHRFMENYVQAFMNEWEGKD